MKKFCHRLFLWTSLLILELLYLSSGVESQMNEGFLQSCSPSEFACEGGRGGGGGGGGGIPSCILKFQTCDGQQDCPDGSDETPELCEKDLYTLTSNRRLSLPPNTAAGTILMRHNNTWRTICGFDFDNTKAQIVCRNLGYGGGISLPFYQGYFGVNNLYDSHLNSYGCVGHESTLSECPGFDWEDTACNHAHDAGVFCHAGNLDVNLVGGRTRGSGLLQVKSSSLSSPAAICGTGFDDLDAQVVCRMLGYNANRAVAHKGSSFGMGSGTIWNIILNCNGTETSIQECEIRISDTQCSHSNAAAVTCTRETSVEDLLELALPADCGEAVDSSKRFISSLGKILGGQVHSRFDVPWLAALRDSFRGEQSHSCGASIISEYYLLTAAHCFDLTSKLTYVVSVGNFNNDFNDPTQKDYMVDKVWIHENYKAIPDIDNDIALIKVKSVNNQGIRFGERVRPVCLPKTGDSYENLSSCTLSGWGQTLDGQPSTTLPRSVGLDVHPDAICEQFYGSANYTSSFSCFGRNGLTAGCRGDSGSPVTCIGSNGRHVLYGIHSNGSPCIPRPFLLVKNASRVTKYLRWIQETITRDLRIHA